jgi:molybdopterin converting factor small subunit
MRITVELFGHPRQLAGEKEVTFELSEDARVRDVIARLTERFPALLGQVFEAETLELAPTYLLNIDGRRAVNDLDMKPEDGQHLLIFFVDAGG